MIRPQAVLLPLLRSALPGTSVVSVIPDVDQREYPMVVVERVGGVRNVDLPEGHSKPVVRVTAASGEGLIEAEELYEEAVSALFAAARAQQVVSGVGRLQSVSEVGGPVSVPSGMPDVWTVGGTVQASMRAV